MELLDLSLGDAAADLACDEALLDACDAEGGPEVLRFWEPRSAFVVLGYANHLAREVHEAECVRAGVPILRRASGGGTVLQAPGCLNYALVLRTDRHPELATIPGANGHVMAAHQAALAPLLDGPVAVQGHTDLTWQGRKFSGNAQRRKRAALLFHGTFLLGADLRLIERLLRFPSRPADYRAGRAHAAFLTNVPLGRPAIVSALRSRWGAAEPVASVPWPRLHALVADQYGRPEWNRKFL